MVSGGGSGSVSVVFFAFLGRFLRPYLGLLGLF